MLDGVEKIVKPITEDDLGAICNRETLFGFLAKTLNWPTKSEDTFTYRLETNDTGSDANVTQIVPFTGADPYRIYLVETESPIRRSLLRESLRKVRAYLRQSGRLEDTVLERLLFICVGKGYAEIRFVRFTQKERGQPRIQSFGWESARTRETRTVRELCLPALRLGRDRTGSIVWGVERWDRAWDVEAVSSEFFSEYRRVFNLVEEMIDGCTGDRRLFTQRLFNRLLFIHFLSRKGWLSYDGDRNYLNALYQAAIENGENVYADRLYWVFFHGLGNPEDSRITHSLEGLRKKRGDVPFLNGGLFDLADRDDEQGSVTIPNEAFEHIIEGLFGRFHFTIIESAPMDEEVAVDPEMLGKVFEELVTGRHDKGAYYTPKPIVSFMCREALKGYLAAACPRETDSAIAAFVDEHDPANLSNPEFVLDKLRSVTVCDPACGSGAYLLGMLHELVELRAALFAAHQIGPSEAYARKLEIIQKNLYGVDNDPFAINVARLRLWLSLSVEFDGDTPPPLPNLDFKIEEGNSLIGPTPAQVLHGPMIAEYEQAKAEYARTSDGEAKKTLHRAIDLLKTQILEWCDRPETTTAFDWQVEFAEVFVRSGFDIIIANPPYVRQERLGSLKAELKALFPEVHTGQADLYCYFYARAVRLLRPGGFLAFISSNKWFRAAYGAKLREYMAHHATILGITDFGELPVFNAATFPMICLARRKTVAEIQQDLSSEPIYTQVTSLDPPYPDVAALVAAGGVRLPARAIQKDVWLLTGGTEIDRIQQMERAGVPLGEYVDNRIYRGVLTGFNQAFVIDGAKRAELIAEDPASAEIIKPLAKGDDIRRWHIRARDRWLIFTRRGIDITRYPAVEAHLRLSKDQLTPKRSSLQEGPGRKPGDYRWYEIQDTIAYYAVFDEPKIVLPDICMEARFSLDDSSIYLSNTAYAISAPDCYLLAILNSALLWRFAKERATVLGEAEHGGRLRMIYQLLKTLPIPMASDTDRATLAALAQKCLDARAADADADVSAWEREIDGIVEGLYGL